MEVKDCITPTLSKMARNLDDFTPVMARVEREILKPMRLSAWAGSGLHSRTGQLLGAVTPWHGKTSAGITLKTKRGSDLILAKAATHSRGAAKGSFDRRKKKQWKVKGYTTGSGRKVRAHIKRGGVFPWADIPAREFFITKQDLENQKPRVGAMIQEYLQNV